MRFLLILVVALSLTLAWQSSVIAGVSVDHSPIFADAVADDAKKAGEGEEEEPECD